ncbi:MAG: YitT family protein [Oscillospiraceae bacterium]|jgi:uncharacterized membrane-anchored protein YitT (DUF2179 family)|nr:YitT family protein [Oscillospiraceae bacterium]
MKKMLASYFWITVGCVIYAIAFDWLFVPNQIGFGGITGIGQILNYYIPALPIGVVVIVLNIPLFLLGWKFLGAHLLISSLYAMAISSVLMDIFASMFTFQPMDMVLASVFGGVLIGASLGIVFAHGATTGGTDLAARLLKIPFAWLPVGKLLMVVDMAVLVVIVAAFRSLESGLYGLIALYIQGIVMDMVLYGLDQSKVAYIISRVPRETIQAIDRELDRGVTILHGEGAYSGQDKQVLMCAFKQREIVALKSLVFELDPDAFIIVCATHEVTGNGFAAYTKNEV